MYETILFSADSNLGEIYEVRGHLKQHNPLIGYVLSEEQAKIAVKTMKDIAKEAPNFYGNMQFDYRKASEGVKDREYYHTSGWRAANEFDHIMSN